MGVEETHLVLVREGLISAGGTSPPHSTPALGPPPKGLISAGGTSPPHSTPALGPPPKGENHASAISEEPVHICPRDVARVWPSVATPVLPTPSLDAVDLALE